MQNKSQKASLWRSTVNRQARRIVAMMHRADRDGCKALNRMAMMDELDILRLRDDRLDHEMRLKILIKREKRVKSACIRLVRMKQIVSAPCKDGGRMYALPNNKGYL